MTSARKAYIAGIGQTRFSRWGRADRSEFQLACDAIISAAQDAGLATSQIDGFSSFSNDRNEPVKLQLALGVRLLRWSGMLWGGGGGGSCGALALAAAAVETGSANYVVVFRSLAQGQFGRYGQFDSEGNVFTDPFGLFSPAQMLALPMRRYMHEFGARPEHFGAIALASRDNANRNPNAVMYGRPLDMETYLTSRMIADPIRLFDCCQENDGACAVIVTTRERARDLKNDPVEILGTAHGAGPGWGTSGALGGQNQPLEDYVSSGARTVARDLYDRSDIAPSDIDVAQIYDNFTGQVLMSLEDFGFCATGEAGAFAASGAIRWPDGCLPINTHGGHLSEAYVHGMNHILEGVRQIRGCSTSQVKGAELCLVTGGPGIAPTSAAVLAKC